MPKPSRRALIIGIDKYALLDPLPSCKNDANDLSDLLSKLGYTNYEGSPFIGSNLIDQEYGYVKVREAIINFFYEAKPSHTLLFYFSGHGIPGLNDVFLSTPHVDPKRPRARGFSLSELTKCMALSKSKRVVGIIDACYSGSVDLPTSALKKKSGRQNAKQALATYDKIWKKTPKTKGTSLLLSSQSYEESYALKGSPYSLYTKYIIEGLKGVMSSEDEHGDLIPGSIDQYGYVTPDSLHEYVYYKVASVVDQVPEHKEDASGKIILARHPSLVKPENNKRAQSNTITSMLVKSEAEPIEPIHVEVESTPWPELKVSPAIKNKVKRLEKTRSLFSLLDNKLFSLIDVAVKNQEAQVLRRDLRDIRTLLKKATSHFETKLYPKITVIKYRWGLASSKFENGIIAQKDYNNQISILKEEIAEIKSEMNKLARSKLELLIERIFASEDTIARTRLIMYTRACDYLARELLFCLS
ncbi:MAG: caspase domain-containing protein [Candidatus Hodarchaeota archaeon]